MLLPNVEAVFFDLDGTLLDTAADMTAALNFILGQHGRRQLTENKVRPYVSKGGMALVKLGFDIDDADTNSPFAKQMHRELLAYYRQNLTIKTTLFPGMENLLHALEKNDIKCGIVTNKPTFLTEPLVADMQLNHQMQCIISGDTLARRKPDPDQLLYACKLIGINPARAVYIGDDERDIECGRRANIRTIAAAYGYIAPDSNPHNWGAEAIVNHPTEIHDLLIS